MSTTLTNVVGNASVSLQLDTPELAETYERESFRQFRHGQVLIELLHLQPGARVLDIGCGTGRLGEYVADIVGAQGQVVGIDPLPLRVDIARGKGRGNFVTEVGHAEDLSQFAEASFDAVYLNSVLHWIGDKQHALREIFRVLKPGGRVAVNSGDAERPHQSKILVSEVLSDEGIDLLKVSTTGTSRPISNGDLRQLAGTAGFVDYLGQTRVFEDFVDDVDQLIRFSSSSSFGNFLHGLDADEAARVRNGLARRLEALRTPQGIRLERYLVFATARKA